MSSMQCQSLVVHPENRRNQRAHTAEKSDPSVLGCRLPPWPGQVESWRKHSSREDYEQAWVEDKALGGSTTKSLTLFSRAAFFPLLLLTPTRWTFSHLARER